MLQIKVPRYLDWINTYIDQTIMKDQNTATKLYTNVNQHSMFFAVFTDPEYFKEVNKGSVQIAASYRSMI